APEIFVAAPFDVLALGIPIGDGGEDGAGGRQRGSLPQIGDHRLARGLPADAVQRDGGTSGADIFAESEEGGVMRKGIGNDGAAVVIDEALFLAGIALDVDEAAVLKEVFVEFLFAADIQDGVGLAVELVDAGAAQAGGGAVVEITRAVTPAALEAELLREL